MPRKSGWKLEQCGGEPFKSVNVRWSKGEEIGFEHFVFAGAVKLVSTKPRQDQTVEVRAHGPRYAVCHIMRPPEF